MCLCVRVMSRHVLVPSLPLSSLLMCMMSRLSLLVISHFLLSTAVFDRELVFTHTPAKPGREKKGGGVIQFDKDQEPLSSLPSGSHPFTQTLEEEYWEACQPLTYSHTLSHIHSNICVVCWGQRVRKFKSLPLISVLND